MIEARNSLVIRRNYTLPKGFGELVKEFIRRAGEDEATIDDIEKQIIDIVDANSGGFWTIWEDETLKGYFYASVVPGEFGGRVLMIHEVMSWAKDSAILRKVDATLEMFGRRANVAMMAFFTRRNPNALIRKLGLEWEIDSIVLTKKMRSI